MKKFKNKNIKALFFGIAASVAFIVFLNRPDIAIEYMKKGLYLCYKAVIPSLFPFMIISEMIISSGFGIRVCKIFSKPMRFIFGVGEGGACSFILGALCGFPIGARTAVALYDGGEIDRSELTRLLTFCNNPGAAFIISAVGISLFGSKNIGLLIYACVLLSSVAVGILSRLFFKDERKKSVRILSPAPRTDVAEIFTSAVQNSALTMLTVCAYVTFFSALIGCLGSILKELGASEILIVAILGFFEISGGMGMAADLVFSDKVIILCAAVAGWSGLAVHFQIMSVCRGRGISLKPYFIAKALHGGICSLFAGIALKLFSPAGDVDSVTFLTSAQATPFCDPSLLCILFFAASLSPLLFVLLSIIKLSLKKDEKIQKKY